MEKVLLLSAICLLSLNAAAQKASDDEATSLDSIVEKTVRNNYEAVHGCYRKLLAKDRNKAGTVFISIRLGHVDAVQSATVARNELNEQSLGDCIANWVRGWTFPGANAAGAEAGSELMIPFTFRPVLDQFIIHADDAPAITSPDKGSTAHVLLTNSSVGATNISLVRLEIEKQMIVKPVASGKQILLILDGKGQWKDTHDAKDTLAPWDALILAPSSSVMISGNMELLQIFLPAGQEQNYFSLKYLKEKNTKTAPAPAQFVSGKSIRSTAKETKILRLPEENGVSQLSITLRQIKSRQELLPAGPHQLEAEVIYVLKGKAESQLKDRREKIQAGDAIYHQPGSPARLVATSPVSIVQIFSPAL